MILCPLSCLYLGSAAAACAEKGHNCIIAEKDEQKLCMIRRRMTERQKSRKQSIYVEDADEKLRDGEEVSIDWIKFISWMFFFSLCKNIAFFLARLTVQFRIRLPVIYIHCPKLDNIKKGTSLWYVFIKSTFIQQFRCTEIFMFHWAAGCTETWKCPCL